MANEIWKDYPKIAEKLDNTTSYIHNQIRISNPEITKMIIDLTSGGKMLRPAFFMLFTNFGPEKVSNEQLVPLSASFELLHVATLIHDDVIDDSPVRRSRPTIHTRYGKRNAIYAGDYLFTLYFESISKYLPSKLDILSNSLSMKKILIGELDQLLINNNINATPKMYFKEVAGKTAELFSLSTKMGAVVSGGDDKLVNLSKNIGHDIGMAFQVIDDVLDFGDESSTGKPNYEDLRNGVYSLPYIIGFNEKNQKLIELLSNESLTEEQINQAAKIVVESGYLNKAKDIAKTFTSHAERRIKKLPRSSYRKQLEKIVKKLLDRID
ncbi:polyprenyl synthetase family protein [Companilactobacillus metriopterae]|uniref:polyprenyl synthetase family protein n=1 Tax=Companilactobacillus metriopterae TaxID=1909267 RepID=UPI00100BB649|nr:polyprenyl synthetase family protein [Companilactobacillus metriopterae]